MSNEEIKRAILEMDEREELAKDMLEQVWLSGNNSIVTGWVKTLEKIKLLIISMSQRSLVIAIKKESWGSL